MHTDRKGEAELRVSEHLHFGATYLLESVKIPIRLSFFAAACDNIAEPRGFMAIPRTIELFFSTHEHKIAINFNLPFAFVCLSFHMSCDLLCNHHYGCTTNYSYQIYLIDRQ
jgi:hypothetical protein